MDLLNRFREQGRPLLTDGAWGTFLFQMGLKPGDCPDHWCLTHPDEVQSIAQAYFDAGSDIVETNSFGASPVKLSDYGLAEKARDINLRAVELSRAAAGRDRLVMASLGPSGKLLMMGDVSEEDLYDGFFLQAKAFADGGADAVCIETMSDLQEAELAIKAVKSACTLPVFSTWTFDRTAKGEYRTMMGNSIHEAVSLSLASGADVIGSNCGNGMAGMLDIAREIREDFPDTPFMIQANAGLPHLDNGKQVYAETPESMAAFIPELMRLGIALVGGCCGTTPETIQKFRSVIDKTM